MMSGGGVFATVRLNMQRSSVSQRVENTRDEGVRGAELE